MTREKRLENKLKRQGKKLEAKDNEILVLNHKINDLEMAASGNFSKLLKNKEEFILKLYSKIDNLKEDNEEILEENEELKKELSYLLLEDI